MRLFYFLFSFIYFNAYSQSVRPQLGGRSEGMGNATAAIADEWSVFNNPGGLAGVEEISVACAYDWRPSLEGANRMGAAFVAPAKFGTIAFSAFKFGDILYNEQLLTAAYAHSIGITSLGAKVNYVQYYTDLFGSHYAASFDLGGITKLSSEFSVGCYIFNITTAKLNTQIAQPVPTRMVAGVGYQISPDVLLLTEVEKQLAVVKPTLRQGMEYSFHKKFFMRTGFNLFPAAAFAGFGLHKYGFKIDYGISYNPILFLTYQASVVGRLKLKRKS